MITLGDEATPYYIEITMRGVFNWNSNLNESNTDIKGVFDMFASDGDFTKTVVPVLLAKNENTELVAHSQAKRICARMDQFKEVQLNFKGVEYVGQGFADELFRVFVNNHPETKFIITNTNEDIKKSIIHVLRGNDPENLSVL